MAAGEYVSTNIARAALARRPYGVSLSQEAAPTRRDYAYFATALAGHPLPAAFVDLGALQTNLDRLLARAAGLPIRLVTKSIRSVGIMRRLFAATRGLQGLLCYSAREAAWLAGQGFDDIVVAYPTVEPADLSAAAAAIKAGATIVLMIDSPAQLDVLAAIAADHGIIFPVAIDLDMSSDFPGLYFGVYRSPVRGASQAVALAADIQRRPTLRLDGLMGYESQIAGLQDQMPRAPGRSRLIRALKRRSAAGINRRRQQTVQALHDSGHTLRFVNGGGSGSIEATGQDGSVTEFAAGSALYAPALFDHYANMALMHAAGFAIPVVRVPRPGMITCAGGGYSASGPAGANRLPLPWLPAGLTLVVNEGAGEVQTPLRLPPGVQLVPGQPVLFRHAKAGELCERFTHLTLIDEGRIVDRVSTYRGDGQCFF